MAYRALRPLRHVLGIWYARRRFLVLCLTVTIGYGITSVARETPRTYSSKNNSHLGWPIEYLIWPSGLELGPYESVWSVYPPLVEFDCAPFLFDFAVAFATSFVATHLWHLHYTRRKPWQFSIAEFGAMTVVVSAVLCLYLKELSDIDRERAHLDAIRGIGIGAGPMSQSVYRWGPYVNALPWYYRPLRDLRLVPEGDSYAYHLVWLPHSFGTAPDINELMTEAASRGLTLSFVEHVLVIDPRLSDEGLSALCRLAPNCPELCLDIEWYHEKMEVTDQGIMCLAEHMHGLRALTIGGPQLTDESVQALATLKKLEYLTLKQSGSRTTGDRLRPLLELPKIKRLLVPPHWTIDQEAKDYAASRGIELQK